MKKFELIQKIINRSFRERDLSRVEKCEKTSRLRAPHFAQPARRPSIRNLRFLLRMSGRTRLLPSVEGCMLRQAQHERNKRRLGSERVLVLLLLQISYISATVKNNLVNIQKINPTFCIALAYATRDNFTHEIIYDCCKCYLLRDVALRLDAVQKELAKMLSKEHPKGLGLKIWDGYRPLSAQKKMWDACAKLFPDEKEREQYVLNPVNGGGRHTRGTTVDLTIIDLATGKELDMGTVFDEFSKKAWRDYADLSNEVKKNRQLLDAIMQKYGFVGVKTEWWHFDFKDWRQFEPLDISLSQLD